tara:strand:- start:808 stop:2388 length:1581 start_codon:yes stop_codon:yes gene_type:complete
MKNNEITHQLIDEKLVLEYNNVGELFLKKVNEFPDKKFIIIHGDIKEEFTYVQFKKKVFSVISYLKNKGIEKDDRISLVFHNSSEFLVLYFAGLIAGITLVPINPDMSTSEIDYIIQNSNSKMIFHTNTIKTKLNPIEKKLIDKEFISIKKIDEIELPNDDNIDFEKIDLKDIGVIIYTSGTTGNPKGVILSHLNLLSDAMSISKWFEFNQETRCLCILPLFHNNGQITTLLAPLYAGGSTVIVRGKVSLFAFWFLVNEYQITWTSVMSSILSILLSFTEERKDNSLIGILCGGQILTHSIQQKFEERFNVPIFEGYGLTETTSFSCINAYPKDKRKVGSIGKPLLTNKMSVLDEDGKEVGYDEEGEICISGYNVAVGYLGDSKLNFAFRDGWFHSGDFGRKDEGGYYYFHGRKDSLIIKGGENVYPRDIENILYLHPLIDECAVIGIPDKFLGENICAFIKIKENNQIDEKELKKFSRDKLADFKQPKEIIIINNLKNLDEIPKGPTKKILYRKLKEYYKNNYID